MPPPLLLVADDLATIAQVKRLLAREGYEMVLATNAADAVIAWGHHLPPLVLISPKVESDRGRIVLEELRSHPDAQLLHVLLLGETVAGFGYPVAPLPLDPESFAQTVNELVQGTGSSTDWQVHVAPGTRTGEFPAYVPSALDLEPDVWRATRKPVVPGRSKIVRLPDPEPEPQQPGRQAGLFSTPDANPPPAVEPLPANLESALFGDLEAQVAREVEAEAIASVDASLARLPVDREQEREDQVAARLLADARRAKATLARAEQIAHEAAAAQSELQQRTSARDIEQQLERESTQYALEAAEALATRERVERERAEAQLLERSTTSDNEVRQLWGEVERLEAELTETRTQLQGQTAAASSLDLDVTQAQAQLQAHSEVAAELELQLSQTRANAAEALREARARTIELEASIAAAASELASQEAHAGAQSAELEAQLQAARAEAAATGERLERERADRMILELQRTALETQLATLHAQSDELSSAAQRAAGELREAIEEAEQSEERAQQFQLEGQQAQADAAANAQAQTETMRVRSVETEEGLAQLKTVIEALRTDFADAKQAQQNLEEALEDARAANLEVRTRAELAERKARLLEERSVLPLRVPHRAPLAVTKFGTADLGELARLVGQVVLARAEIRLELAAPGGRRTVWLNRGAVTAAESTFSGESLLDRARRDGLIDARQTAELQMLRSASPAEAVSVLKERGFLREAEVVPLVQRYTEQVALDAFSEPTSEYRLAEEGPGNETLAATLPRPTLPLVAEALRRALPVEELLARLGGSEAVPTRADSELDLRALGFSDKERRMLGYCDGEANVEDLALASGLKADVAFRALLVARLLGLVELKVPLRTTVAPSPQLDVKRLEAKFEQVQDADYFTMLGVGRAAGGDEVQRAWQRLSEEFDPIKYSGHPDAGLQQRAQVVYSVLEEAARALADDRRRADYASHLID